MLDVALTQEAEQTLRDMGQSHGVTLAQLVLDTIGHMAAQPNFCDQAGAILAESVQTTQRTFLRDGLSVDAVAVWTEACVAAASRSFNDRAKEIAQANIMIAEAARLNTACTTAH